MGLLKRLSIQTKLILLLLAVSITAVASLAYVAFATGRTAVRASVFDELTSVRSSKKNQIEARFEQFTTQVINLSNDPMTVDFMKGLKRTYGEMRHTAIEPAWDRSLTAYYRDDFLPKLAKNVEGIPELRAYIPKPAEGRYFQYWYIAFNNNPTGKKYNFLDPDDGSDYSALHRKFQPYLVKFVKQFEYENVFLIDNETGDVVYTFAKTPEFATNLRTGPYSDTNLRTLFEGLKHKENRSAQLIDFAMQPAALGLPVSLIGSPIYDGDKQIGILGVQIPVEQIDRVMTGDRGWPRDGLGKTGEAYLVGSDHLMRSDARLFLENRKEYFKQMTNAGLSADSAALVQRIGTTVLAQPVRTQAVQQALAGEESTAVFQNARGVSALMSYAPLKMPGLNWVIVAEIEQGEAFGTLDYLSRQILFFSVATLLVITAIAGILASRFVGPIHRLVSDVDALESGRTLQAPSADSEDEFDKLAAGFFNIANEIRGNREKLKQRAQDNQQLVGHVMPAAIAARFHKGEKNIVEEYTDASVLAAHFDGLTGLCEAKTADEAILLIADLIQVLDEATERFGVEKVVAEGSEYLAACGMSVRRLDHSIRLVDFGLDVLRLIARFNSDRGTQIGVQIAVDTGGMFGALIGSRKMRFELIGHTIRAVHALVRECPKNSIIVTSEVRELTSDLFNFDQPLSVALPGQPPREVWPVKSEATTQVTGKGIASYV